MEFKDRLKELRLKNNLTQAGLAEKIYTSRSAVAKWENGLGLPNDVSLDELCRVFNVSRDYLFKKEIDDKLVDKNIKIHKLSIMKYAMLGAMLVFIVCIIVLSISLVNKNKDIRCVAPRIYVNGKDYYYAYDIVISKDYNQIHSTILNEDVIDSMRNIKKTDEYAISSEYAFKITSANYYYIDDEYNYVQAENFAMSTGNIGLANKLWYNPNGYNLKINDNVFTLPETSLYFIVRIELLIENINYTYFFLIK